VAAFTATFYPPGSQTPRTQCGALSFSESPGTPGTTILATANLRVGYTHQSWSRGTRGISEDTLVQTFLETWTDSLHTNTYDAPANDQFDQVAFGYRHSSIPGNETTTVYEVTAVAQLWRAIPTPTVFSVARADSHAVLS
jgi:hypothetical protein